MFYQRELVCVGGGYKEPNQHKWGPGCRDMYSLHYIISGRGYVKTGGQTFRLEKGLSFLIYPGEEYYYYPDEKEPWEYVWVDFYGKEADRLISMTEFTKKSPVMETEQDMRTFFEVYADVPDRLTRKERESANVHLLLTRYFRKNLSEESGNIKGHIQLAKEYVGNYYWRSDLSVSEIAKELHIDRTYLYRLFKDAMGMSPL